MSNLHNSTSDRSAEANKASASESTSRSKSFLSNLNDVNELPSTSSHPQSERIAVECGSKGVGAKVMPRTIVSSIDIVASRCENIGINSASDNEAVATAAPIKKNEVRKHRKKELYIPQTDSSPSIAQSRNMSSSSSLLNSNNHMSPSVQELFMKQIAPMYVNHSSRYLENLSYHPQYQYMCGFQTPLEHQVQGTANTDSVPNTPVLQQEYRTPHYYKNVMNHPLLSKSFSVHREHFERNLFHHNLVQSQMLQHSLLLANTVTNHSIERQDSPRRQRKKNKNSSEQVDDKKFEPYISLGEVENGLKSNNLIEGVLRINPKQFIHSYVSSSDRSEQDVLIDGIKNRNRALEGDIVVVQLLEETNSENNENDKQKKGKVVYIKDKVHTRTCIGTLKLMQDKNRQKALFVPRDHRVPRLNISSTSWPDNFYKEAKEYENTLFLAKIVEWADTRFAVGTIVCMIGQSGDMMSETKAILAQNDLDITPFGPEVRDLYPRLDYTIPEEEFTLREDCRKLCLFSIDPNNCRDIDDAVSCIELDNGNYEIGVHISDVSHFLTENTILDEKVAEKATTIYLVEKAYHMLPDDLCMLCSLFPGVDKLAFSVFWEITKDAKVISHRFAKTVIHSCCQLAYEHAQAVLDDKQGAQNDFPEIYNGFEFQDIHKTIKTLGYLAATFRQRRFEGGALRIDQPKVSFHLSCTDGLPDSFWIYESKESHQLIEEFMLLANMTVAERIFDDHPKLAFLRCHPPPSGFMLKQLAKALKPMGIDLDISSAGHLHRSLLPHVGPDCKDTGKAMVLNMLCAKPMTRAKYFCAGGCDDEDYAHYALNVPLYTHFTSPIRRYADIMVHRLLSASLKYRDTPKWEIDKVRSIAAQCNKQKYNAKKAGEMSTELYTLKYIEMHSPLVTKGVVVEVREKYIDVIIVAMGLNRRIFFNNDFPGQYKCIKNDAGAKLSKMELVWNATDSQSETMQVIEVFSILQVEMHKGDDMVKVETKLVHPKSIK